MEGFNCVIDILTPNIIITQIFQITTKYNGDSTCNRKRIEFITVI